MVRSYKRKKVSHLDTNQLENLAKEYLSLKPSISLRQFAKSKGISYTTTYRWVKKLNTKMVPGHPTVLSAAEESLLITALKFLGDSNMGQDREDIANMVQEFLKATKRPNPFKNGRPGKDWIISFEKRNPQISLRSPEILTIARSKSLTPEIINIFFDKYQKILTDNVENGLDKESKRTFSCDETGLNTDAKGKKIYTRRGKRDAYLLQANCGKSVYSVLVCSSAAGQLLPPFVVYKGKNLYSSWTKGGPPGTGYSASPSGWMHDFNFENWFETMFIPSVAYLKKPVVLIFDGHNSHLTFKTIKLAIETQIVLLCLIPHASHRLQPLDVGFFCPFKIIWRDVLKQWYRSTRQAPVTKPVFPTLLNQAWEKADKHLVTSGFVGTGLFPVNRKKVVARIFDFEDNQEPTSASAQTNNAKFSPRKVLIQVIAKLILPEVSPAMEAARQNQKSKRKRVQAKTGEILTESSTAERLQQEEDSRKQKATKATKATKAKRPKSTAKKSPRKALFPGPTEASTSSASIASPAEASASAVAVSNTEAPPAIAQSSVPEPLLGMGNESHFWPNTKIYSLNLILQFK